MCGRFPVKWLFSFFILLVSCASPTPTPNNKPLALVSIAPYLDLVRRIGGEILEVQTVVPQSANPHSFEPTVRQVKGLSKGVIWFRIGESFEKKLIPLLQQDTPDLVIHDLLADIELLHEPSSHGCSHCSMDHLDRHVWLSPKIAAIQVEQIRDALSTLLPEHATTFYENSVELLLELAALDREIRTLLEPVQKRHLLVSHPAFGYFCRDYDIEQFSIEYEGKDPRPHHLEKTFADALRHSVEFTLALPQHNNKGAQVIAERLHVPVKWIDPYSENYFEMMRRLAHLIADESHNPS
jgi:zinc transport system substrate-binding protein